MLVFSARNLFFILCQKLIIVGEDLRSKGNWKFNSRKGESGGKQLESRIGMNYSRYLLGSSDPIDRFLSYFKGAILHEVKTVSRNFSSSWYFRSYNSDWDDRIREARSKFYFIAIPNDRSLAIAKLFFLIWNKLRHPVFSKMRIFFMGLKKIIRREQVWGIFYEIINAKSL